MLDTILQQITRRGYEPDGPGLAPPAGVESNFVDPSNKNHMVSCVDFICLGLVVVFVTLRFYARLFQDRKVNEVDGEY